MHLPRVWSLATLLMLPALLSAQAPSSLVGTWALVSRVDRDAKGQLVPEPSLGTSPTGYLIYDATGHVAAQMMASVRTGSACVVTAAADANNPAHINGYDAYFGRYEVDAAAGIVRHHLDGALPQADVGRTLERHFQLAGDTLTITFRPGGEIHPWPARTIVWHRVG
jgi:catechol 1,2-dioxygenase